MRPAFDEGQGRGGFPGQEPFVPETDKPRRDLVRFQSDVFRPEFLVSPPVADTHAEEHAFPREGLEEWIHEEDQRGEAAEAFP
jgi:hypothetical protein